MKFTFDLVDQPWVPCILPNGSVVEFGLQEILARAHEIREVSDSSPLVTAALHRLLLAILHRNFGPTDAEKWSVLWKRGSFDGTALSAYLEEWHDRFDLFDDRRPFYQTVSVHFDYKVPFSALVHELASGNNATLFDHTVDVNPPGFSPKAASRYLLAHHAFAPPGLVSLQKGENPKLFKSADAGPLANGAVALVKGKSLFETLMLNLHVYSPPQEEPFPTHGQDLPAWERTSETLAEDRFPAGFLDLLTWQSRRIRLYPEICADDSTCVRWAVRMKGNQFPDAWSPYRKETMLAFTRNDKTQIGDPWLVVSFKEDRALWRDSLSLFQSIEGTRARPMVFDWVNRLASQGKLDRSQTLPVDFFGCSPEKGRPAKLLLWRHERLPLPLAYLQDPHLVESLTRVLGWAKSAGICLRNASRRLASLMLAPTAARSTDKGAVGDLARSFGVEALYWSRLEAPFRHFLEELAADAVPDDDGTPRYGDTKLPQWTQIVRNAARAAFEETARGLHSSPRSLKAIAVAEDNFRADLNREVPFFSTKTQEVMHARTD